MCMLCLLIHSYYKITIYEEINFCILTAKLKTNKRKQHIK